MSKLTRYEQETVINFNAEDKMATVYTRDPTVIRKVDELVIEYPDTFRCVAETDIDKTYEIPKSAVTYRKPRKLSESQREEARKRMRKINKNAPSVTYSPLTYKQQNE